MSRGTRQPQEHYEPKPAKNQTIGCLWVMGLGMVALIIALIYGIAISISPARQALALEEARATQPYRIAARITGFVVWGIGVKVAGFVLGGYGIFYLLAIARNWLDLRARQVHARDGLFPVIQLGQGVLYDPNRDNAGAHPLITMAALGVQKQAAMQADRLIVRQVDRPQLTGDAAEALQTPPTINLPAMVRLAEVAPHPSLESLVLGVGEHGLLTVCLNDMMHVLAIGSSGYGKSALLRALLWQFAQVSEPLLMVGIDCFGSELNPMGDWNKLLFPVAKELPQAEATLRAVMREITRRKELYAQQPRAFDLHSYNQLVNRPLSPIVMMVDEGTAMLNTLGIADPLREVVQTARQYGVYALVAGQSVNHRVMPTQTRDQFSTRLCFHTSQSSRHVVLGETTTDVTVKGRAWAQLTGQPLQQIQCPYVTREEVLEVIQPGTPQQTVDVESRPVEDDRAAQVLSLKRDGASDTRIAREVFGFGNTHYIEKVRTILQQQQQTPGN